MEASYQRDENSIVIPSPGFSNDQSNEDTQRDDKESQRHRRPLDCEDLRSTILIWRQRSRHL